MELDYDGTGYAGELLLHIQHLFCYMVRIEKKKGDRK